MTEYSATFSECPRVYTSRASSALTRLVIVWSSISRSSSRRGAPLGEDALDGGDQPFDREGFRDVGGGLQPLALAVIDPGGARGQHDQGQVAGAARVVQLLAQREDARAGQVAVADQQPRRVGQRRPGCLLGGTRHLDLEALLAEGVFQHGALDLARGRHQDALAPPHGDAAEDGLDAAGGLLEHYGLRQVLVGAGVEGLVDVQLAPSALTITTGMCCVSQDSLIVRHSS
ncbi:MAG: hypothetical protein KatS3mg102_0051 [Planctomycetota bacterium]|nr:MAG: hypothetical protein KatS3mg102_0051 [Planctomycetota bacterium]